jgi:long-subunit acyl-CoA synthetase (AMP-forming)
VELWCTSGYVNTALKLVLSEVNVYLMNDRVRGVISHSTTTDFFGCVELQMVQDDLSELPLYQYTRDGQENVPHPSAVDLLPALTSVRSDLPHDDLSQVSCLDKVLYIYTSGTTGLPKAAVITHIR